MSRYLLGAYGKVIAYEDKDLWQNVQKVLEKKVFDSYLYDY